MDQYDEQAGTSDDSIEADEQEFLELPKTRSGFAEPRWTRVPKTSTRTHSFLNAPM